MLAVGTEQGAPIPRAEGGFVTDANGQVVVPQLDAASLQRLAAAGGGRYAALAPSDRDLDTLFPMLRLCRSTWRSTRGRAASNTKPTSGSIAASCWSSCCCRCSRSASAAAGSRCGCSSFSRRCRARTRSSGKISGSGPTSAARRRFEAEQAERAAELFENPEWRSAAQYRAGQFEASAASLSNIDSTGGHYNRGNALAKAGQLPAAIAAYDRALELDPVTRTRATTAILSSSISKDNPQQQPPQDQGQGEQGQQGDSDQSQSQSGEQQDGGKAATSSRASRASKARAATAKPTDGAQDSPEANDGEQQGEESSEQDANAGEEAADEAQADAAGPEEVEQWASEQAAEQWLRRVPQDPGRPAAAQVPVSVPALGVDQNGNRVVEGAGAEQRPW